MRPEGIRIVVLDDNKGIADTLAELLNLDGYEVNVFYHPQGMIDAFINSSNGSLPNFIMLDVEMDGMSGPEAVQRLEERGIKIPHAYMTGLEPDKYPQVLKDEIRKGRNVVKKPFDLVEMEKVIEKGLNGYQLPQP